MTVGAVVLHYRRWPGVRDCLDALLAQTNAPDELVIVDNHSGDGSASLLRAAYPGIRVVEADENLGYGAGMNLGISCLDAQAEAILLLTHECVLDPDALGVLCARMRANPRIGAVGPLLGLRSDPNTVYSAGGWIDRRIWRPRHFHDPSTVAAWQGAEPREVEWLDGSALFVRRAAIEGAGCFDEDYFMYFEDTDLLLRIGRDGWRIECVPAAVARQQPGAKPRYLWTRNRLRFLARRAPRRALIREVVHVVGRAVRPSTTGGRARRASELSALVDFARGRHGPPAERRRPAGSPSVGG